MEERVVVGVLRHESDMGGGRDGSGVGEAGEVEEEVGEGDGDGSEDLVDKGKMWPGGGEVEIFRDGEEEEEEDQDRGVAVIHYEVEGPGGAACYATRGEPLIQGREEVGQVYPCEPM